MISAESKRVAFVVTLIGPIVTLAISPWSSFDPINPIKLLILSTLTSYLIAVTTINFWRLGAKAFWKNLSPQQKVFGLLTIIFILALNIPLFFADSPLRQQIWGVFGRNTGLITYLSLALLGLAVSLNDSPNIFKRIIYALYFASIINTAYCIVQIFEKDPIGWSSFAPFGTLGNVNFLSAFLGISTVVLIADKILFNSGLTRFFWGALVATQMFVIIKTDSVQGLFVVGLGFFSTLIIWIWKTFGAKRLKFLLVGLSPFVGLVSLGLFEKGPLGRLLFQQTNVFRLDYWNAAVKMLLERPFTGVGLDGYVDWYLAKRGFISAYRTGPSRTSNSAHNIFLDIASNGGVILFCSFIAIFLFVLVASLRYLKATNGFDKVFVALFSGWIGFSFQSLVSINQIGVAVWGWIAMGLLISYMAQTAKTKREFGRASKIEESNNRRLKGKKTKANAISATLPPLYATISMLVAILFAWLISPVYTLDQTFKRALSTQDQKLLLEVTSNKNTNSFIVSKLVEGYLNIGNYTGVKSATDELLSRFPRDHYGYRVALLVPDIPIQKRSELLSKVRELDPYGACVEIDPVARIDIWFKQIPSKQKVELLRWWRLIDWRYNGEFFDGLVERERYLDKLRSFCT